MNINHYKQVMQVIKGRREYINWIVGQANEMGRVSIFMVEGICLQLRMTIEDIAVACVVANAEELPDLARSLRGEYRPSLILKGLEAMNPNCFPVPMVENLQGSYGNFRDTHERPAGDWLTREDTVKEYGKLNDFLHRNLKAYTREPTDIGSLYEECCLLEFKVSNLLSHHQITVLDENIMYRVMMAASGVDDNGNPSEGHVQVVEFIRVPENLQKAVLEGNLTVDEIEEAIRRHDAST